MATNISGQFTSDIEQYIAQETLPLTQRQLVVYQFGDPETLPKGRGTSWTATRFNRVPLPYAPLSEGVPPNGETMSISQVTVTLQQWGDKITVTDVAEMTIKHPVMNQAKERVSLQVAETLERNTFNNLFGGTQINYVNSRGARASLVAGDVINTFEISRAYAQLVNLGAPEYLGQMETDMKKDAKSGGASASANPRSVSHYIAVCHPFIEADIRQNTNFVQASAYSDVNKLYNNEAGQWGSLRFCRTNMTPSFTGIALVTGTPGSSGSLVTSATYNIQVTGSDLQNQYESQIYQVSGNLSVTGPNGSISVTTPNTPGYTYSIYIGTTSSPANLALTASGPTSGPLQGQAVQIPYNTTVILTGIGLAQSPPAAPATGVSVYPTFIFGKGAYAQVVLDEIKITWLDKPDKGDPLNQQRVVGWKCFYGTLIKNNAFMLRLESTSAFNTTFG
jgi:N4-gp56 family major capsid protein